MWLLVFCATHVVVSPWHGPATAHAHTTYLFLVPGHLQQLALELGGFLKVMSHVGAQHHIDHERPQLVELGALQPNQRVVGFVLDQREELGNVVRLQHALVVVADGKGVGYGDVEGVVEAGVSVVVDGGSKK